MYKALIFGLLALVTMGAGCSGNSVVDGYVDRNEAYYEENNVVIPENPYSPGSGHYAGFEWAERTGRTCGGNSTSFIEGCQEYYRQVDGN